jgi:hypothetical protein
MLDLRIDFLVKLQNRAGLQRPYSGLYKYSVYRYRTWLFLSRKLKILPNQETTNFFSCGSGITACIDYLAYEIIGTTNQRQFMMVLGLNGDK